MKKLILFFTTLFVLSNNVCSQIPTTKLTMNDVFSATELTFYGYDFTNFRLVEPDRIDEGAKIRDVQFAAWNAFVINEISMNRLAKWFRKSSITYYPVAVTILNSEVEDENIVTRLPYQADKEEIKQSIASYEKPKNSQGKIGMVVNVESFIHNDKQATGYVTFFEVSTGAVIYMEKMSITKPYGMDGVYLHGITNYWGMACFIMLRDYFDDVYKKGL